MLRGSSRSRARRRARRRELRGSRSRAVASSEVASSTAAAASSASVDRSSSDHRPSVHPRGPTVSTIRSSARSRSAAEIVRGGATRMVVSLVSFTSTPCRRSSLAGGPGCARTRRQVDAGPQADGADRVHPAPRAGDRGEHVEAVGELRATLAGQPLRLAAAPSCRSPRGRPRTPAGCRRTSSRASRARACRSPRAGATTAEIGTMPPPSAFPSSTTSGTTPSWSQASVRPVRPRPDWISSAMSSTPCRSHTSRTAAR